jgi:uncharacterized membrane protein
MCAYTALVWPYLPDRIATHFDFAGHPNGWSSRSTLALGLVFLTATFAATFLASSRMRDIPPALINLPNRDYWLASDRFEETMVAVSLWLQWFVALIYFDLTAVIVDALESNVRADGHMLLSAWLVMAVMAGTTLVMIGVLYWRFRIPS